MKISQAITASPIAIMAITPMIRQTLQVYLAFLICGCQGNPPPEAGLPTQKNQPINLRVAAATDLQPWLGETIAEWGTKQVPSITSQTIYGGGYYVSTYNGQILGTNTSSFPGVYIPGAPFQTTFGYQGDLDTLGPFGRGHTPLNPPGPSATFMPGISAPLNGGSILP